MKNYVISVHGKRRVFTTQTAARKAADEIFQRTGVIVGIEEKQPRGKNPLTMAVDRKSGKVRATYTPPHIEVSIRNHWVRWSRKNFPTMRAAVAAAKQLLRKHRHLKKYAFRVVGGP